MAVDPYAREGWSPPRTFAAVAGIVYLLVAALEAALAYTGDGALAVEGWTILEYGFAHTVGHALVGLVLLGCSASAAASRAVARLAGIVFLFLLSMGLFARGTLGAWLEFSAAAPWAYVVLYGITAAFALWTGFASPRGHHLHRTA